MTYHGRWRAVEDAVVRCHERQPVGQLFAMQLLHRHARARCRRSCTDGRCMQDAAALVVTSVKPNSASSPIQLATHLLCPKILRTID